MKDKSRKFTNIPENVICVEPTRVIKDYAVGIYARVSTNSKEQLDSLSAQVSELTRLAAAHIRWDVADVFIDVAFAKTGSSRHEFNRMIEECENGHIEIVLTKSISRFGRDTVETLEAVRRIRKAGKRIIFQREGLDTETTDGDLIATIIEACEQVENEWRSENICWGFRQKASDGSSGLYNRPCYGYKKDKDGGLIIDEEQAAVVRRIFDSYLMGKSVVGILKELESAMIRFIFSMIQMRQNGSRAAVSRPGIRCSCI